MSRVLPDGAFARGVNPEREVPDESGLDRMLIGALGHLRRLHLLRRYRVRTIVRAVNELGDELDGLGEDELRWQAQALRGRFRMEGFTLELVSRAFALIRALSVQRLGMRHFDVQLMGGWSILNGTITEMRTGEGKTLTATLPACTLALAGVPVHIVTVNDYLAARDAEWMGPLYEAIGVRVGSIVQGMDRNERREAYRCDVTYCTNKEIVFDYLRDRLEIGRRPGRIGMRLEPLLGGSRRTDALRLRGLYFAIVDEADSVLIDEARTPLIISGTGNNEYEAEVFRRAWEVSAQLETGTDFFIDFSRRSVEINDAGSVHLEQLTSEFGGIWNARRRREELVRQALTARNLFHRDKHYVVKDGKVEIVDEYTGRVMPNRSWEGGLHQLIETKEGVEPTPQTEVLGRISYQRFFRRYLSLSGMTGTANEARREFWTVYRRDVTRIPPNRKLCSRRLPTRVFHRAADKWNAVVQRVVELHVDGRPILIGTRTVAASQLIDRLLREAGLEVSVLNALQDAEEAEIIARAGERGMITVATNMAGRGTDIKLGDGVAALGGLHVILTERHDAGRIDRQLFGRCARQGEPGSFESYVSAEDDLLRSFPPRLFGVRLPIVTPRGAVGRWFVARLSGMAQRRAERTHYQVRRDLLKVDESLNSALAFTGKGE